MTQFSHFDSGRKLFGNALGFEDIFAAMNSNRMDVHVEAARLQQEIRRKLGLEEANLIFEFKHTDGNVKLNLITINPRHEQSFLFHSTLGVDEIDSLNKMLDYVTTFRQSESSYTIQWAAKNEKELQTSYFRARNIMEALDKLYYGRDMHSITVYSVVLNPIS